MAGFGVLIKAQFHYLHLTRETGRNWSAIVETLTLTSTFLNSISFYYALNCRAYIFWLP
jgi:hypothetical protein